MKEHAPISFRDHVPIATTMAFEKLYHPNLAMSYRDKVSTLKEMEEKLWMFVGNELVGEIYGCVPYSFSEKIEGCEAYPELCVLYVYSTSILKPFQGQGLGKILKAYFHGLMFGKGYKVIIGHATTPHIWALNEMFGAYLVKKFENWYGTGQTAMFYQIEP